MVAAPWQTLIIRVATAGLTISIPLGISSPLQAYTLWQPISAETKEKREPLRWESIPREDLPKKSFNWEPLSPEDAELQPEQLVWDENIPNRDKSLSNKGSSTNEEKQNNKKSSPTKKSKPGLLWPNGQLMSKEDQIYFRTAYSRGSMIQIGETVYPNIGFNALQRKPGSFASLKLVGIDDSWQSAPSPCKDGDFFDQCADGLMENWIGLWATNDFSFDLQWTIHSLSGEGAPFSFSTDTATFGADDTGTKFGEGQSIGFKLSKNFGKTFGISIGGDRIYHFDKTTDLPRNFHITATKVFRLKDSVEPPILSLSLGIRTDVYNPETNLGTMQYPSWLRGGNYPSVFSDQFDDYSKNGGYSPNTAGVSSAYICAEQSVYKLKPIESASPDCIKDVFIGPVASIGFAPWPWVGIYATYENDINFGISFKPFKEIPWQFGFELVAPIKGVNPGTDNHINYAICPDDNESFSSCRTRLGFLTELSF